MTGGNGWIGRAVCSQFKRKGFSVVSAGLNQAEGPWDDFMEMDISRDPIISGVTKAKLSAKSPFALIHCAGYAHRPYETPEEVELFGAINDLGTQRVVDLCEYHGIPRIVYLSSIAFYDWGALAGSRAKEDSPLDGKTAYACSKLKGEQIVRESGLDWRVARLATVFGREDRANFRRLANALARGRFVIPGAGVARKSVLPVDLAGELLMELALLEVPRYRLLNLALPDAPTLEQICRGFSDVCGFPVARQVPLRLLKFAAAFGDIATLIRPEFPLNSMNIGKLTTSTHVDVSRMIKTLAPREWGGFSSWLNGAQEYYRMCG